MNEELLLLNSFCEHFRVLSFVNINAYDKKNNKAIISSLILNNESFTIFQSSKIYDLYIRRSFTGNESRVDIFIVFEEYIRHAFSTDINIFEYIFPLINHHTLTNPIIWQTKN